MLSNWLCLYLMKSILVLFILFNNNKVYANCPQQWIDFNGFCYRILPNYNDIVPWGYAQRVCKSMDPRAHLPIFNDSARWTQFVTAIQLAISMYLDSVKRQITDPNVSPYVPLGGFEVYGSWYWVDGSKIQINEWQQGQPPTNLGDTQQRCMGFDPQADDIEWIAVNCSSKFLYGCQLDPSQSLSNVNTDELTNPVIMIPNGQRCDGDWVTLNGACYQIFEEDLMNFEDGIDACTSIHPNATLPQFWTYSDYDIFSRYLGTVTSVTHQPILLGAQRSSVNDPFRNKDWTWSYSSWKPGQPNGTAGNELCIYTSDVDGYTWTSLNCTIKARIICQLDNRTPRNISGKDMFHLTTTTLPDYAALVQALMHHRSHGTPVQCNCLSLFLTLLLIISFIHL